MQNESIFIAIVIGLTIFLSIIMISVLVYESSQKNTRYMRENPSEWLFHNFSKKLYEALYGEKDPTEVAIKLGIKIEDYYKNCELIKTQPDAIKIIIHYIYGVVILIISPFAGLFFNPLFILVGFMLFYILSYYETEHIKSKANDMRSQVKNELPKFLDLLSTELEVGLSVDNAIRILSEKYDSLLSREFLESLNDVELGASGWQTALEKVAQKYSIDTLSDFVLDITIAFNKGVSVAQSVAQLTKDIKKKHLLDVKEQAGKTENTILIPIALLQFIPMLIFLLLPTLMSVSNL